jgi:hypothetical protein
MGKLRIPPSKRGGIVTELQTLESIEVISELEFRALHANEHYRNSVRSLGTTIQEAIACGEHLEGAKANFSEKEIAEGQWGQWVEANFEGSRTTAKAYMRLARNKSFLPDSSDPPSINAALKMLASPKVDKPEKDQPEESLPGGIVNVVSVRTPDGEIIEAESPEELAEALGERTKEIETRLNREVEGINRERELLYRDAAEQKRVLEQRTAKLDKQFAAELARVRARYDFEEKPSFLEISDEDWAAAFAEAKSARVMQVAKHLNDIYSGWPRWMGEYLPGEAARAIEDLDHADAMVEALRYVADWLERTIQECEASLVGGS